MKRLTAALAVLVVWAAAGRGQTLRVPAEVKGDPGAFIVVRAETEGGAVRWVALDKGLNVFPAELLSDRKATVVTGQRGSYRLLAYTATLDKDGKPLPSDPAICTVVIGDAKPIDPPPPPDGEAPIPDAGNRALFVYESGDVSKLPRSQLIVLNSAAVRDYLNAHCVVGPDGKTREWRLWDADVSTVGESPLWQRAFARPRKSTPWLILSNGRTGYEGPLPATVDETLALMRKIFGG